MTDSLNQSTASQPLPKLTALRSAMVARGLTQLIVTKSDAYQNENVPDCDNCLPWLTGFTGSAGAALIGMNRAVLVVDSRYTLQAKAQADATIFHVEDNASASLALALAKYVGKDETVGYDPRLHTIAGFKSLSEVAARHGFKLLLCSSNLVDAIWLDRPAPDHRPITVHALKYAGESATSKLARVQAAIAEKSCGGLMVTAPDAVAWLFNIRGDDVMHTPIALVQAYIPRDGKPILFAHDGHIDEHNRDLINALVDIHPATGMADAFASLPPAQRILVDPARATVALKTALTEASITLVEDTDPCTQFKAHKNEIELKGARNAHLRDGVALCRFLQWLDTAVLAETVDEIGAAAKLEAFRHDTGLLRGLSFDTVAGAGPNGAIVHYRATPETNRTLEVGSLFLIDSGGQYEDGTTDVTRTVAVGEPTARMKRHFTLVLQGHIAIAAARFPAETRGVDLDPFARRALWAAGLDYGHGTGHGVGSYLSVHEAPPAISRNIRTKLEPSMIVSNEPGLYLENEYGIRIENLLVVLPPEDIEGGQIPMMAFETLTLAPIDRRLVDIDLLSVAEIAWVDAYHNRVYRELGPLLEADNASWLQQATQPLHALTASVPRRNEIK